MWWLSFRGGGVVILTAASLAHARLLAAIEFGYASHFVEGYPISPDLVELIPGHSVGRMLSPLESRECVRGGPEGGFGPREGMRGSTNPSVRTRRANIGVK
jgi:hypothetical protein